MVPNGYVVEVTLKGAYAAQGYAHSVGVWLEPGWCGPATVGIRNATRYAAPDGARDAHRRDCHSRA